MVFLVEFVEIFVEVIEMFVEYVEKVLFVMKLVEVFFSMMVK